MPNLLHLIAALEDAVSAGDQTAIDAAEERLGNYVGFRCNDLVVGRIIAISLTVAHIQRMRAQAEGDVVRSALYTWALRQQHGYLSAPCA